MPNPDTKPPSSSATLPPSTEGGTARLRFVVALLLGVWMVLAGRLLHLQYFGRSELTAHADRQSTYLEKISARPGDVLDRHGRLLATTITVRSLWINPSEIQHPWKTSLLLGEALGIPPEPLFEAITKYEEKQFLWVKRRISDEEADRVAALGFPKHLWGFRDEYLRRYPQGRLAAHVLGLRDIDGVGQGGLEEALDELLRGKDGRRVLVRDARGRVIDIEDHVQTAPQHGQSIRLTLDSIIQLFAEEELDQVMQAWRPKSACAIVVDPHCGEILAMASRPTLDPNSPVNVDPAAWKNTAIAAIYEPGSTFKPMVVAWGLEQGVISKDETFHCENGNYRMGSRVLHDHHPYGQLSITDILVKSSNIGMAKIGERLTNEELHRSAVVFGFGRKTGIELAGELKGILHPLDRWNIYSTGSIPMGQEISVTPLQLIMAQSALANGGKLMSPLLVLNQGDFYSEEMTSTLKRTAHGTSVVSPTVAEDVAKWVVQEPMVQVVERGTGKKGKLDEYTVFGKTGTAQKVDAETGRYSHSRHVTSFICGAPAENPAVLVLVVVDEPTVPGTHYGGTVAAPPASNLLRRTLIHMGIPGEKQE